MTECAYGCAGHAGPALEAGSSDAARDSGAHDLAPILDVALSGADVAADATLYAAGSVEGARDGESDAATENGDGD